MSYIIFLVVILSMWMINDTTSSGNRVVTDGTAVATHAHKSLVIDASSIIFPDVQLCLSRTIPPIHIHISQQSNKRNDTETRHNTLYLKSGKYINTGVTFSIYNYSKLFRSLLSEPIHRLISLGKLII